MLHVEIVSVGNANLDIIVKVPRLPVIDEKVLAADVKFFPGGGASNFAVACSRLGVPTGFIGCIGDDYFGRLLLENFRKEHVDTSHIKVAKNKNTGFIIAISDMEGKYYMVANRGANLELKPENIDEKYISNAKLVHGSSLRVEIAESLGFKAKKLGVLSSIDIGAELTHLKKERILKILENFDFIFLNKTSYKLIFGVEPTSRALLDYFPKNSKVLAVTLGKRGAVVCDGKRVVQVPAVKVKVVDTVGAGDAFAAAFLVYFIETDNLETALKYAMAEAAIKVQKLGGQEGLPTRKELERFFKELNVGSQRS